MPLLTDQCQIVIARADMTLGAHSFCFSFQFREYVQCILCTNIDYNHVAKIMPIRVIKIVHN